MGLDYEILENEYNKIATDKAEVESRTDLTDEERATVLAGFDKALEGIESGIIALGTKQKEEIQAAIKDLEAKLKANEEYIKAAEEELARRQAEIEEEIAKENPDQGLIEAKQAEVKALEKRIKSLKSATRKIKREVKEQNKLLIPLMHRFKDKIFSEQEIAELEKLDKRIQSGKALSEKTKKQAETVVEEPVTEEPVVEEPVVEEPVVEEPVVEEPVVEEPTATEPVVEEPTATEPVVEEPTATEPVTEEPVRRRGGSGTPVYVVQQPVQQPTSNESKDLKTEFNELYIKAKNGTLSQQDYTRLGEIVSETTNYDELGITTGLLNNKAKVVLKAMGKFATKNVDKTVADARKFYDIHALAVGDEIISTERGASWAGIKEMARTAKMKLASQEVFERVVAKAEEIGIDNLTEEQRVAYEKATGHLRNMESYRKCIDTYSEVRQQRMPKIFAWLLSDNSQPALPEAGSREPVEETATIESVWTREEGDSRVDTFASRLGGSIRTEEEIVAEEPTVEETAVEAPTKEEGPEI